jgi:osmotically-inducible protein OsmY
MTTFIRPRENQQLHSANLRSKPAPQSERFQALVSQWSDTDCMDLRQAEQSTEHQVLCAVSQQLLASSYRAVRAVHCRFCAGELTLRGRVPNFYQKQLAQESVRRIPGVLSIVNLIEVVE